MDGIFGLLPKGAQEFLGVARSGGESSTTSIASIGSKIAAKLGWGAGSTTSAVPGAIGSVKGPAVLNYGARTYSGVSSYAGGQGAGAGSAASTGGAWGAAAGAALVAAIGVYGFSQLAKKQRQRFDRQHEFFSQVGTGITEPLGEGVWDYRGMLNDAETFFSTTRDGWQSTIEALGKAGVLTKGWGASLDENGKGLVKIHGDIDGVKTALSNAVATGYSFAGSLTNAIEKGNNLRVSIQGDSEVIATALNSATAMGIGGFRNLETTTTGVSATLTGDIA